ncbi:MAG: MATE family efflux transporter [Oscillospiraceae bacterium]|nr:MATE family efflux transporter [Oscillospiraceae bacterium]
MRNSLTEGSIWKSMLVFAFPVLLSNLLQLFYDAFDAWTVGYFLGDTALAAVASSSSLIFLLVGFCNGLSMGAGVVIARHFGAKNYDAMNKAIHTAVAFGITAGLALTVLGVGFTPTILKWMDTPADVLPQSVQYFRFYFCGAIFVVMYNMCVGILHAVGDSRHPLYFLMFSTFVNVVLDLTFVGVLRLGVGAAAVATTVSQGISAMLCCVHLLRSKDVYRLIPRHIRFDPESLQEIVRVGLPSGVQNSMISVANVFVQSSINSFGSAAMAGCGAHTKLEGFAFLPVVCFSQALSTFVSQNLGAKQYNRIRKGILFGVICGSSMAELYGIIAYFFAPQLISVFNDAPAVLEFGSMHMRTICLFYFLMAFSHCMAAVFRGAGKASVPMYTMLLFWCFVRIAYIRLALPHYPQLTTVSWAYPITWTCSCLVFIVYYFSADWMHSQEIRKTAA